MELSVSFKAPLPSSQDAPKLCLQSTTTFSNHLSKTLITAAARNNRRRRPTLRISRKAALECALFIASSLKVIPEPVSLMLKQGISGGGGGGNWVWKGFGGDGSGDGWRRRKRRMRFGIWGLVMLIAIGVMMFGNHCEGFGELGLVVLVLGMLERDWKTGPKGWVLGFCCCGLLMLLLALNQHQFGKWCHKGGIGSSIVDLFNNKTRGRRRRFL